MVVWSVRILDPHGGHPVTPCVCSNRLHQLHAFVAFELAVVSLRRLFFSSILSACCLVAQGGNRSLHKSIHFVIVPDELVARHLVIVLLDREAYELSLRSRGPCLHEEVEDRKAVQRSQGPGRGAEEVGPLSRVANTALVAITISTC